MKIRPFISVWSNWPALNIFSEIWRSFTTITVHHFSVSFSRTIAAHRFFHFQRKFKSNSNLFLKTKLSTSKNRNGFRLTIKPIILIAKLRSPIEKWSTEFQYVWRSFIDQQRSALITNLCRLLNFIQRQRAILKRINIGLKWWDDLIKRMFNGTFFHQTVDKFIVRIDHRFRIKLVVMEIRQSSFVEKKTLNFVDEISSVRSVSEDFHLTRHASLVHLCYNNRWKVDYSHQTNKKHRTHKSILFARLSSVFHWSFGRFTLESATAKSAHQLHEFYPNWKSDLWTIETRTFVSSFAKDCPTRVNTDRFAVRLCRTDPISTQLFSTINEASMNCEHSRSHWREQLFLCTHLMICLYS